MSLIVSDRVRSDVAQSLPLLETYKDPLIEALEAGLAAREGVAEAFGQAEITAMILVDLLLRQARALAEQGDFGLLDEVIAEHRALDIDGGHYSRFGDTLVPALQDVIGPALPREMATAWCELFWTIIRAARSRAETARLGRAMETMPCWSDSRAAD